MDLDAGDRLTAEGFEWEVLTHPTVMLAGQMPRYGDQGIDVNDPALDDAAVGEAELMARRRCLLIPGE